MRAGLRTRPCAHYAARLAGGARAPPFPARYALACASPAAAEGVAAGDLAAIEAAIEARRGSALLVNFWATWCPPCVAELPELAEVARAAEERGARVLGISFDLAKPDVKRGETLAKVRAFAAERELPFPTLVCEPDDAAALDHRFQLGGAIPVTLAFDRSGTLVDRHEGQATREQLEQMLAKALAPASGR